MLREWERKHPGRVESIFNALGKVEATPPARPHADRLRRRSARPGAPNPRGDIAFDVDPLLEAAADAAASNRNSVIPVALG